MGDKISEEKATLERENFCPKRSDLFSGDFNLQFHLRHRKKRSLVVDDWYAQSLSLSLSLSLVHLFSLLFYLCKPASWLLVVSFFFPKWWWSLRLTQQRIVSSINVSSSHERRSVIISRRDEVPNFLEGQRPEEAFGGVVHLYSLFFGCRDVSHAGETW